MRSPKFRIHLSFAFLLIIILPQISFSQNYNTVAIGNQVWMKWNLNIPADTSYCYKNEPNNCEVFGRLYNWETAINICPEGFRLPSDDDWTNLTQYVGGLNVAGYKLMAGGETGFNVLLGGNYSETLNVFSYQYRHAYFWTSTSFSKTAAWMRNFVNEKSNINRSTVRKDFYFNVRCIKN